jgi:hypothetical protein
MYVLKCARIIHNRINRSLENWYLSKLNETTVNKSHDDILIEYLKNISTETKSSQNSREKNFVCCYFTFAFFFIMFSRFRITKNKWISIGTNFPTTCLFYYSIKDDLVEFHKPRNWVSTTCHFFSVYENRYPQK